MTKFRFVLFAFLTLVVASVALARPAKPAQTAAPSPKPSCSHAICRVAGAVMFAAEDGIDVVHGALDLTKKGLTAVAPVKVLMPLQYVVTEADAVAAKVDDGAEAAERFLFGVSN